MIATLTSSCRAALAAAVLAIGFSVTTAEAATAPAGLAVHNAAVLVQGGNSDVTSVHYRHRFHRHPYFGFNYRPYYSYRPPCGWRKRCWYDDWGYRHCRWVNTCRRYY